MQMFTEVFRGNMSSTSWDMVKVDALRSEVFLQTTDLQQCVDQDAETDPTAAMALDRFSDQLTALHTQERCSWELIRNEFRIAFRQLKKFLGKSKPRTPNSSK
ncbi:hypothetical protein CRUP_004063 [Coryphaenoides rupestris]|nr:hypothetical protein CRUP_004063 [Coryphaenoides rupestris]